jgi:hypothetical protein
MDCTFAVSTLAVDTRRLCSARPAARRSHSPRVRGRMMWIEEGQQSLPGVGFGEQEIVCILGGAQQKSERRACRNSAGPADYWPPRSLVSLFCEVSAAERRRQNEQIAASVIFSSPPCRVVNDRILQTTDRHQYYNNHTIMIHNIQKHAYTYFSTSQYPTGFCLPLLLP